MRNLYIIIEDTSGGVSVTPYYTEAAQGVALRQRVLDEIKHWEHINPKDVPEDGFEAFDWWKERNGGGYPYFDYDTVEIDEELLEKPPSNYTFDVTLLTTVTIPARSQDEARKQLHELLDGASANFGCFPDGSPIVADVGVEGELEFVMDDGPPEFCAVCDHIIDEERCSPGCWRND